MKFKRFYFIFFIIILNINMLFCNYSYGVSFSADVPSVILFNSNTGKILYEKNGFKKMYPASTTKIMTAILVLENCSLEDNAIVSKNATKIPSGYLKANLQVGEIFSIKDLLYLLLVMSANDAAIVLAEHVGGNVNSFSNMMNTKAKEIGCLDTHFVNPNGIHNDNHYSTSYDLCLMANYAMKNDIFREIVSTKTYIVSATNKSKERILMNTNRLLHQFNYSTNDENLYYCEFVNGIKTGYTENAKNCLVASAKKNGAEYIVVILGAELNETNDYSQRYSDAKNLFETAFNSYSFSNIKKANDTVTTVQIKNGDFFKRNLNLILENNIETLINIEDLKSEIVPKIELYEDKLQAPISKGEVLGTATYIYNDISYTENIIANNDVPTNEKTISYLKISLGGFLILICLVVIKIVICKKEA